LKVVSTRLYIVASLWHEKFVLGILLPGSLQRVRQQFRHAVMQLGRIAAHIEHVGAGQTQFRAQAVEDALACVFDFLVEGLVHVYEIEEENGTFQQSLDSTNACLNSRTAVCSAEKTIRFKE
jgi:tRNA G37 N-methylase Trm5